MTLREVSALSVTQKCSWQKFEGEIKGQFCAFIAVLFVMYASFIKGKFKAQNLHFAHFFKISTQARIQYWVKVVFIPTNSKHTQEANKTFILPSML